MPSIDLTPFGFTPTESKVYEVLLHGGPGTGYAIAQAAGLARANTYSALEGLVSKGAALVDGDRPKRFRPEAPAALIARLTNRLDHELERLSETLVSHTAPATPTVVEIDSPRGVLQIISQEVARARERVRLLVPADAYPLLSPSLRRAVSAGLTTELSCQSPLALGFANVTVVTPTEWPGEPIIAVIDRAALIGARSGTEVSGHWSAAPSFVAAASQLLAGWRSLT